MYIIQSEKHRVPNNKLNSTWCPNVLRMFISGETSVRQLRSLTCVFHYLCHTLWYSK